MTEQNREQEERGTPIQEGRDIDPDLRPQRPPLTIRLSNALQSIGKAPTPNALTEGI